jgi:hypothetical protein
MAGEFSGSSNLLLARSAAALSTPTPSSSLPLFLCIHVRLGERLFEFSRVGVVLAPLPLFSIFLKSEPSESWDLYGYTDDEHLSGYIKNGILLSWPFPPAICFVVVNLFIGRKVWSPRP